MRGNQLKAAKYLEKDKGSTTIPKGSTPEKAEMGGSSKEDGDIVLKTRITEGVIFEMKSFQQPLTNWWLNAERR